MLQEGYTPSLDFMLVYGSAGTLRLRDPSAGDKCLRIEAPDCALESFIFAILCWLLGLRLDGEKSGSGCCRHKFGLLVG
jgi:hypothetical protein